MDEREEIIKSLQPLFEKAEKEKLWFYCNYQDLWFSPKELKDMQKAGRFIWGEVNWTLQNPMERVTEMEKRIKAYEIEKEKFIKRIQEEK